MNRQAAYTLLTEKLRNKNLFKHSLAAEACLKALAPRFSGNEELWSLAGLLHDIDYEETDGDPARHGIQGGMLLEELGFDPALVHAVKAHCGHVAPSSDLDWALFCVDPLTGLIVASALMHPDKKLDSLDSDFVMRRFKEKRFAAGANREQIAACKNLGLELEELIEVCLESMKSVAQELGL